MIEQHIHGHLASEVNQMILEIKLHHLTDLSEASAIEQARVGEHRSETQEPTWNDIVELLSRIRQELNSCTQPYFSIDYVYALHKRLDEAEKDRDEFAIGFHNWWVSAVMAGYERSTKELLSEYKSLNQEKKRSPVIGTGIPEGGKDYE